MGAEEERGAGRTTSPSKRETRFVQLSREHTIETMDAILVERGSRLQKMVGALALMNVASN